MLVKIQRNQIEKVLYNKQKNVFLKRIVLQLFENGGFILHFKPMKRSTQTLYPKKTFSQKYMCALYMPLISLGYAKITKIIIVTSISTGFSEKKGGGSVTRNPFIHDILYQYKFEFPWQNKIGMCKFLDNFHVCYRLAVLGSVRLYLSSDSCQQ